jgi:hypothetical protein
MRDRMTVLLEAAAAERGDDGQRRRLRIHQ